MKNIKTNDLKMFSIFLGIAATLMIFLPALIAQDSETSYTGLQVIFGYEFANLFGFASGEIVLSIVNLIAYALPLGAALLLIFAKDSFLAATIIFAAATGLLLFVPEFTVVTVTVLDNVNEIAVEWTYGLGLIIAIILSLLGFAIGLFTLLKKAK